MTQRDRGRLVGYREWVEGGMCVATNGYRTSFGDDGNILEFYVIMVIQLCEYTKKNPLNCIL